MADINKQNKKYDISIIAECAVLIAVGTILAQIKIYRMPNGGSVTAASMVPFLLIGFRRGPKWGILSGFVNALLQMLIGSIYPPVAPGAVPYVLEILLDYLLAYMVLGLSGSFKNVGISTLICCALRFLCSFLSGFLVWGDVLQNGTAAIVYSFTYNLSYLGPETAITFIVILILHKSYPKIFKP